MTALWIVLGIFGVLLLLLLWPISVTAEYQNELSLKIRYLFFTYRAPSSKPEKEKQAARKEEKQPAEHKKTKLQEILEQKGLSGFLHMLKEMAGIAASTAKKVASHLVFTRFRLEIVVADEDAAQAAVQYGYVCGGVSAAMSVFLHNCKCKRYHVHIIPDFDQKESSVVFSCKVKIKPLFLGISGLHALVRLVRIRMQNAKEKTAVQQNVPAK